MPEGPVSVASWQIPTDAAPLTIAVVQYRDGSAAARLNLGGYAGVILDRGQVAATRLALADVLGHLFRYERNERRRAA